MATHTEVIIILQTFFLLLEIYTGTFTKVKNKKQKNEALNLFCDYIMLFCIVSVVFLTIVETLILIAL